MLTNLIPFNFIIALIRNKFCYNIAPVVGSETLWRLAPRGMLFCCCCCFALLLSGSLTLTPFARDEGEAEKITAKPGKESLFFPIVRSGFVHLRPRKGVEFLSLPLVANSY